MEPTEHDIAGLFDVISGRYDLLNHVLSGYTDVRWRRTVVRLSLTPQVKTILDVSTGTGDMALAYKHANNALSLYGVDISMEMLRIAGSKSTELRRINGSALSLPFKDNTFDLVSCAFGIRNIYPRERGLQEFYRVTRPGGRIVILEFSMPRGVFGMIYKVYFERILPLLGNLISRTKAYSYLQSSVEAFPDPQTFGGMLTSAGFRNIRITSLTRGVATIYRCEK